MLRISHVIIKVVTKVLKMKEAAYVEANSNDTWGSLRIIILRER